MIDAAEAKAYRPCLFSCKIDLPTAEAVQRGLIAIYSELDSTEPIISFRDCLGIQENNIIKKDSRNKSLRVSNEAELYRRSKVNYHRS
jgi:hypothetical protein